MKIFLFTLVETLFRPIIITITVVCVVCSIVNHRLTRALFTISPTRAHDLVAVHCKLRALAEPYFLQDVVKYAFADTTREQQQTATQPQCHPSLHILHHSLCS